MARSSSRRVLLAIAAVSVVALLVLEFGSWSPPPPDHPAGDHSHGHVVRTKPPRGHRPEEPHRHDVPAELDNGLMNGVILYLYGGRWQSYFTQHALPRLDRFFLRCWPYPVHIFHEDAPRAELDAVRKALRVSDGDSEQPLSRVEFEDVSWIWKRLPKGVSEDDVERWRRYAPGKKLPGRGYRIMCRFWAGLVWRLPSLLEKYKFYWRLDTDSILTRPLKLDPFRYVFETKGCVYGFNRLKGEAPAVTIQLWETWETWAETNDGRATLTQQARQRVNDLALINKSSTAILPFFSERYAPFKLSSRKSHYWGPMFYNNFEMGTFELKQRPAYTAFFKYVDTTPPYGIFRYRWGDAPLHTLGVVASAPWSQLCNVSADVVGYQHANMKPGPIPDLQCSKQDP